MFKFILIGAVIFLLMLVVAEPALTAGRRIANRIRGIAEDIDDDEDENDSELSERNKPSVRGHEDDGV